MNLIATHFGTRFYLIFFCLLHVYFDGQSRTAISIMTYNVENLFDSKDDPDTDDETYLPRDRKNSPVHKAKCKKIKNFKFRKDCYQLDWNSKTVQRKLKNISHVILSVDQGKGPDILILAEVENRAILNQLNHDYLKSAGYKTIALVEGPDPRGIDVAILSRFPSASSEVLFPLDIVDPEHDRKIKTRGILKVSLRIMKDKTFSVFAVHLPSQASPTNVRIQALEQLNQLLKKESDPWIVGGDFNISREEDAYERLLDKYLSNNGGDLAHRTGCEGCQGTHFYKGKWSFLDMLYFSKKGLSLEASSVDVVGKGAKPKRFSPDKGQGTSDHFPLYARLKVEK
ncbi:MAG: endonuclease/exonuclease/phosphatase family protein [Bdellovibrionaceae bacterium]|nr:endonuclease/exonuclease/phosphatase family protein [Pseudobdellovibrionaceae bacterium]